MKYFFGLEVTQTDQGIFICQHMYATDILQRFRMDKCKPAETPISLGTKLTKNDDRPTINATLYKTMVGNLMYLTATRPDLMYAVSLISRFMESPKNSHWNVGKRILRYVAGTLGYGLWYTHTPEQAPPQPSAPTASTSALPTSNQPKEAVIPPPQTKKPSTTIPQTENPDSTFAGT